MGEVCVFDSILLHQPFCGPVHYTSSPLPGESASSDKRFAAGYSPVS